MCCVYLHIYLCERFEPTSHFKSRDCQQQHSYSGLRSPGRSNSTYIYLCQVDCKGNHLYPTKSRKHSMQNSYISLQLTDPLTMQPDQLTSQWLPDFEVVFACFGRRILTCRFPYWNTIFSPVISTRPRPPRLLALLKPSLFWELRDNGVVKNL